MPVGGGAHAHPFVHVHRIHARGVVRPSAGDIFRCRGLVGGVGGIVGRCGVGGLGAVGGALEDVLCPLAVLAEGKHRHALPVEHVAAGIIEGEYHLLVLHRHAHSLAETDGGGDGTVGISVLEGEARRQLAELVPIVLRRGGVHVARHASGRLVAVLVGHDAVGRGDNLVYHRVGTLHDGQLLGILIGGPGIHSRHGDGQLHDGGQGVCGEVIRFNGDDLRLTADAHARLETRGHGDIEVGNLVGGVLVKEAHLRLHGEADIPLVLGVPHHAGVLVGEVAHHEGQRVVLYADGHLHGLGGLALQVHHDSHHAVAHLPHGVIVEVGIVGRASHTVLDVLDGGDEDGGVLDFHRALVAHGKHPVMSLGHVLVPVILLQKDFLPLAHEDRRCHLVLLRSPGLILGI